MIKKKPRVLIAFNSAATEALHGIETYAGRIMVLYVSNEFVSSPAT